MVALQGFILLVLSGWYGSAFGQAKKLVLNTGYPPPITSPDKTGFLDLLYGELFRRLDIPFEIQFLPSERALLNANEGIDDGDVCRVPDLGKMSANMVRTTEPIFHYRLVAFSRDRQFRVNGPDSLKPYDIGIAIGWKLLEWKLTQHKSRTMVDSPEQLFRMLDQGRVEVVIIDQAVGMEQVRRLGLSGVKILSPPLFTGDWHLYLHRRHAALIPVIDRELRRMKKDGSFERIRRGALGQYD
jgi:polar amino acid transport system substrate-binding protein